LGLGAGAGFAPASGFFSASGFPSGVSTFFGKPYRSADGSERVDFESRGTFRSPGLVVVTVTGCPVVP
jgi:hypothetical protein